MPGASNDARPMLAATASPLLEDGSAQSLRDALAWMSSTGFRGAQLSATDAVTRPRDLGASARRDLRATLARHELICAGVDFFIPVAHFTDPANVSRAFEALAGAIGLAADLDRAPVTVALPSDVSTELRASVAAEAARRGVAVLIPNEDGAFALDAPFAASVDCAAVLASGGRPEEVILRLGSRLGGVRVADLLRSALRGPILEPRESRLDARAVRVAVEVAGGVGGFRGLPVLDARQWSLPAEGLARSVERWKSLAT